MLLFIAALTAAPAPDLGWLSGYWLSCEGGREVSEAWGPLDEGAMKNTTLTRKDGKLTIEIADILFREGAVVLRAQPPKQPPTDFALKTAEVSSVVFENLAHDFPQRVSYRREGEVLHAQIDGEVSGKTQKQTWTYRSRPINARCP